MRKPGLELVARTARRLTGPRLFRGYCRHPAVFYRPSADGSKLRRPFLSDRYFFIAVCLLRRGEKLTEPDFALLARAFNRAYIDLPICPKQRKLSSPRRKRGSTPGFEVDSRFRGSDERGVVLNRARSTSAGARRANCGNRGSSTVPCAASRNTTKRSNTFT